MADILAEKDCIDASLGIQLRCPEEGHSHEDGHSHEEDPHIWLSPANAMVMARNICDGLSAQYPQHRALLESNRDALLSRLEELENYGNRQLATLSCRELITFHDGFGYFADAFGLTILAAVEEESGSEASAQELKELITLVQEHQLGAIFVETNGATSAAQTISAATGAQVYMLDMAMSGDSWLDAMYHNIDIIKEALG